MTIPSIKFQCPKCKRVELHILDTPQYCRCDGKGQTKNERSVTSISKRSKVRKQKFSTGTRMIRIK